MQKIVMSLITTSILLFGGCKPSGGGDPKEVVMNFFDALIKKDFTALKKYTTKDSESMIGLVQMGMQHMEDNSNALLNYKKENIELGSAVIDGDKATIPVKDKKSGEITDVTLKKESGGWKVAFDKSTVMEMGMKKMKEHGAHYEMNDKNKTGDEKQDLTMQIINSDSAKNELKRELHDALLRLDVLKTSSTKADSLLKAKDKDIYELKYKVQGIINNKYATDAELAEATKLMAELKGNIEIYQAQAKD